MEWHQLLSGKRVREIYHPGEPSFTGGGSPDARSEFEKDYGRVTFSTALRRLQDKAQVFPLEPNDAVRTRLTHSLEVSNVATSIANQIGSELFNRQEITQDQKRDMAAIAATCGLIHDLGNPPFGHAGEVAICDWFKQHQERLFQFGNPADSDTEQYRQDFLRFDGNPQTFRIVTRLQLLNDEFGLNFTAGTLSALRKYTAPSDRVIDDRDRKKVRHSMSKVGHFASEQTLVEDIRQLTGTNAARNPIAAMVEAADDAVYSTVDVEDAIKKGVVTWDHFSREVRQLYEGTGNNLLHQCLNRAEETANRSTIRDRHFRDADEARTQVFRTLVISHVVESVSRCFIDNREAIMSGGYDRELVAECDASALVKACKRYARDHVFPTEPILRLEVRGRRVIQDLLTLFWDAIESEDKLARPKSFELKVYRLLSVNHRKVFKGEFDREGEKVFFNVDGLPKTYRKLQLITDYVCGMTDTFACTLHKELWNGA